MTNLHPRVNEAEKAFEVACDKFLAGEFKEENGEKNLVYKHSGLITHLSLKDLTFSVSIFEGESVIVKFVYGFDGFSSEYPEGEVFNKRKNLVLLKLMMY